MNVALEEHDRGHCGDSQDCRKGRAARKRAHVEAREGEFKGGAVRRGHLLPYFYAGAPPADVTYVNQRV